MVVCFFFGESPLGRSKSRRGLGDYYESAQTFGYHASYTLFIRAYVQPAGSLMTGLYTLAMIVMVDVDQTHLATVSLGCTLH